MKFENDPVTTQKAAVLIALRVIELAEKPLPGPNDLDKLASTHAYIFQDFGKDGLPSVNAGRFRPEGDPIERERTFESIPGKYHVAYSGMGDSAKHQMAQAISQCEPEKIGGRSFDVAGPRLAEMMATADYAHPFVAGNGIALRTFATQVARDAGVNLNLKALGSNAVARDRALIARDKAVIAKVVPDLVGQPATMQRVALSAGKYSNQADLQKWVTAALKPLNPTPQIASASQTRPNPSASLRQLSAKLIQSGYTAKKIPRGPGRHGGPER